jgi:protein-disulfide isomerase
MGDRLRFVFRVFPLTRIHDHTQAAAEAAAAQGRFWEMHDRLFEAHRGLGEEDLLRYAEEIGLDVRRFGREMAEHAHAGRVRRDLESGLRSGVPGTPTFFINRVRNGVRHDGSHDFETLLAALEGAGG